MAGQGVGYQFIVARGLDRSWGSWSGAATSLRTVCPAARVVLVCEPQDEPAARRALNWGADDYQILPVNLERILTPGPRGAVATASTIAPARPVMVRNRPDEQMTLASLPLVLQTSMMDRVIQGQGDLAKRAVAILQTYKNFGQGTLDLQ